MAKSFASVTLNIRLKKTTMLVQCCEMALGSQAIILAWIMPLAILVAKMWGAFTLSITITREAVGGATRAAIMWVVKSVDPGAVALNVAVSKVILF
jgi:hypothetical protein